MKKALAHQTAPQPTHARKAERSRLVSGLALIGLLAGLGLFASRPAHTVGGPVAVAVSNLPLPTSNVDSPDQQPFQLTLSPSSSTASFGFDSYTVPAGKRVVLEFYSAQLTQYPSGGYGYLYLITTVKGNTAFYKVIPPVSSTAPVSQMTRIYADPGTTITAEVFQSSGTSSGASMILSGHFVNVSS